MTDTDDLLAEAIRGALWQHGPIQGIDTLTLSLLEIVYDHNPLRAEVKRLQAIDAELDELMGGKLAQSLRDALAEVERLQAAILSLQSDEDIARISELEAESSWGWFRRARAAEAEVERLQALVARMTHADAKAATVPIDAAFAVSPTPTEPATAVNVADMGRKVDVDDIINAGEVADIIGLSHRNGVYQYRHRHPDFPAPLITHGRCYMWHRGDIKRWIRARVEAVNDGATA